MGIDAISLKELCDMVGATPAVEHNEPTGTTPAIMEYELSLDMQSALKKSMIDTMNQCRLNMIANMFDWQRESYYYAIKREKQKEIFKIKTKGGQMPWKIRRKG